LGGVKSRSWAKRWKKVVVIKKEIVALLKK